MSIANKLSIQDASFLYFETPTMPMNIGSVQAFELPGGSGSRASRTEKFYQRLRTTLARRAPEVRFMSCKLKPTPFAIDHPVWVYDQDFSIDAHLTRIKLTGKGTQRQLEQRISELHEIPLERDRPMWKYYMFEGMHDGTVVLYEKYHHACFDGVTGQQIMDLLFTEQPGEKLALKAVDNDFSSHDEPATSSLLFDAGSALAQQFVDSFRAVPAGLQALGSLLQDRIGSGGAGNAVVPRTPFNRSLSRYRDWTCTSIPLSEAKAVAKHNNCTLNDLFLAICGGGVKRYLERKEALPDETLVCGVPVSLHQPGDDAMKNSVSMIVASLATDKQHPRNRIAAIKESMQIGKRALEPTAALTPDDFHLPGIGGLVSLGATLTAASRLADVAPPVVNMIISNVPGPRTKRYLCGAEMLTHYPVSIPGEGLTLNITCQSYLDRLDIGFTACLEAVPDLQDLKEDTWKAWQELKVLREIDLEDTNNDANDDAKADVKNAYSSRSGSMTA